MAACKRYRAYAREHGLVKTLSQKRRRSRQWISWLCSQRLELGHGPRADRPPDDGLGMDRILWSRADTATVTAQSGSGQ